MQLCLIDKLILWVSDGRLGSDRTLGQGQLPGGAAHCVGQLSHLTFLYCVRQH